MPRTYTTYCPDCGQLLRFYTARGLSAQYPPHKRPVSDVLSVPCTASGMPVITESVQVKDGRQRVKED